jgi:threonine/homoserine/homoserine lactone efflux protein
MLPYLVIGISYGFAAAVQPGPLQSYLISRSLSHGWQRTLPATFAPLISDGPVIVLILLVVNQIPAKLIALLQIAGGFFLLYISISTWKTWKSFDSKNLHINHSGSRSLFQATFINFLNPSLYLGWSLIMGPLLIRSWRESPSSGIALIFGFYSLLILTSIGIIILFSFTRKFGIRITRVLIGISAIVLGLFSIYQLWNGASNLQSFF